MKHQYSCILGIDPGLETTGFGVIECTRNDMKLKDYGAIVTKSTEQREFRLVQIADDIEELLDLWKPDLVAIEKLVFVKNVTSGLQVAEARGVITERVARRNIPLLEFNATEVKKSLTGNGKAPKIQIQNMIRILFHLAEIPRPDDAADAIAVAITGRNHV